MSKQSSSSTTATEGGGSVGGGGGGGGLVRKRGHSPDVANEAGRPSEPRQSSWPRTISRSMLWSRHVFMASLPLPSFLANQIPPLASLDESEANEVTRYMGSNSIPALLREQSSTNDAQDGADIRQDMRSILGLDTSAPFPLMSPKHLDRLTQDISSELPSDREVIK
jgi:hypothetical protein